jgi:hypothetical protein
MLPLQPQRKKSGGEALKVKKMVWRKGQRVRSPNISKRDEARKKRGRSKFFERNGNSST